MADNNSYKQTPRRRGPGGGMAPAEKAKNFKGSISKLMQYIGRYKIAILAVMIMAAASTVFTVIGPKVLGKATTEIFNGLIGKISGGDGIDFDKKIFNELINYAISNLKRAKAKHDIIEACYVPNMNFAEIEKLREDLVKRILKYENN